MRPRDVSAVTKMKMKTKLPARLRHLAILRHPRPAHVTVQSSFYLCPALHLGSFTYKILGRKPYVRISIYITFPCSHCSLATSRIKLRTIASEAKSSRARSRNARPSRRQNDQILQYCSRAVNNPQNYPRLQITLSFPLSFAMIHTRRDCTPFDPCS